MKEYLTPDASIVEFGADVITTSSDYDPSENTGFIDHDFVFGD